MINFRFHLVSITAIFLALAAGIAIGAAVVDRASVDLLRSQLDEVEARRQETNRRNDELKLAVDEWNAYAEQAGNRLVDGQLAGPEGGIPVLVVAVEGVDRAHVSAFEAALQVSGAAYQGAVWLTPKWALDAEEADAELAGALGIGTNLTAETVRRAAIARLGRALLDGDPTDLLVGLRDAGFVEHAPVDDGPPLAEVPTEGAAIVVISGEGARVENAMLATPLVQTMAATNEPFIVVQPGGASTAAAGATDFVSQLRANADLAGQVTTVDSLHDYRGRIAAVLAVRALSLGITGHYGLGLGAERILPELPPPAGS